MVREVQSRLSDGGYYQLGAIDGIWGTGTETAVKNFQRDHDLGTSGKLDVPTLQALNLTATAPAAPDRPAVTSLPQTGAGDTSAPVQQR
jgi:peptidoglycan hydrolase-like protein with peptidoglycan-binding domain